MDKGNLTKKRQSFVHLAAMNFTNKPVLKIDWATNEAAKFACVNWHYSKCVPVFKSVRIGVWEADRFIGVVMFGQGASPNLGNPYGLTGTGVCELTRVALRDHITPVSRIIAIAFKFLKRTSPNLRLIVSFADMGQGHHGGIYQAGGWIYASGVETHAYVVNGEQIHPKSLHSKYGIGGQSIPWLRKNIDPNAERIISGFKHRYLMPLDAEMRAQIAPLAKPYPKRTTRTKEQDAGHPPALEGVTPIRALQLEAA
jgi:hypothetical protein